MIGDNNVLNGSFVKDANDYITIKMSGIPMGYEETHLIFCVYARTGEKLYYLDNGETKESVAGKSYNEVIALNG
jgi:hypothetical protein